jgi:hypothetical protein
MVSRKLKSNAINLFMKVYTINTGNNRVYATFLIGAKSEIKQFSGFRQ